RTSAAIRFRGRLHAILDKLFRVQSHRHRRPDGRYKPPINQTTLHNHKDRLRADQQQPQPNSSGHQHWKRGHQYANRSDLRPTTQPTLDTSSSSTTRSDNDRDHWHTSRNSTPCGRHHLHHHHNRHLKRRHNRDPDRVHNLH